MRPNNICCMIVGEHSNVPACCVIAYKNPEVRVTILIDKNVENKMDSGAKNWASDFEKTIKKCWNRNLFFSSDYSTVIRDADIIFISINDSNIDADDDALLLKQLGESVKLIAQYADSDMIIVENSSVPMQATEKISTMLPSPRESNIHFQVLSNPGFLAEESTLDDLLQPERVLIGRQNNPLSRAAALSVSEFYEQWIPHKNILILNERSVEICKLAGKAFLAQQMSSMNSFSELCDHTNANILVISDILGKGSRNGSKFLNPSAGLGLFQTEISNLISLCQSLKLNEVASYWQAVLDLNEYQKTRWFKIIESILGPPRDKEISIWGLCYDKSTRSTKNSPALEICKWLLMEDSKIKIYDPEVQARQVLKDLAVDVKPGKNSNIKFCNTAYEASTRASGIIICTDRNEFVDVDYSKIAQLMSTPLIIDGKNLLNKETMKNCGIDLHPLGLDSINL